MAIVGTDRFHVTEVDSDSLLLTRADGVGGSVAPFVRGHGRVAALDDVATPLCEELCGCHDLGGDCIDDLVIRFSTRELVRELELGAAEAGEEIELKVSGYLYDGTLFEASDCITIVGRPRGRALRSRAGPR